MMHKRLKTQEYGFQFKKYIHCYWIFWILMLERIENQQQNSDPCCRFVMQVVVGEWSSAVNSVGGWHVNYEPFQWSSELCLWDGSINWSLHPNAFVQLKMLMALLQILDKVKSDLNVLESHLLLPRWDWMAQNMKGFAERPWGNQ